MVVDSLLVCADRSLYIDLLIQCIYFVLFLMCCVLLESNPEEATRPHLHAALLLNAGRRFLPDFALTQSTQQIAAEYDATKDDQTTTFFTIERSILKLIIFVLLGPLNLPRQIDLVAVLLVLFFRPSRDILIMGHLLLGLAGFDRFNYNVFCC